VHAQELRQWSGRDTDTEDSVRRWCSCLCPIFVFSLLQCGRARQGLGSLREKAASHRKHHPDQVFANPSNVGKRVSASRSVYPTHPAPFRDPDVEMTGESKAAAGGTVCLLAAIVAESMDASVQAGDCLPMRKHAGQAILTRAHTHRQSHRFSGPAGRAASGDAREGEAGRRKQALG
jgi:hypothetical protein